MMENQDKLKLLVVDDSEINREIFIEMLDKSFDVLEAEDCYQAIDMI